MLGYRCNHCGEFISQSRPRERRDCPTCHCPAAYTVPFNRGMVPKSSAREGGAVKHTVAAQVADMLRDALAKVKGDTDAR